MAAAVNKQLAAIQKEMASLKKTVQEDKKEIASLKKTVQEQGEALMTERNRMTLMEAKQEEMDADIDAMWEDMYESSDDEGDEDDDDDDGGEEVEYAEEEEEAPKRRGRPPAGVKPGAKTVKKPACAKGKAVSAVPSFAALQKSYDKAVACTVPVLKDAFKKAGWQGLSGATKGELMKELGHGRKYNAEQKKKSK